MKPDPRMALRFSSCQLQSNCCTYYIGLNLFSKPPLVIKMSGPVGPRVPKDEFMRALRLDHNDPHHEGYYRAMRVCLPPDWKIRAHIAVAEPKGNRTKQSLCTIVSTRIGPISSMSGVMIRAPDPLSSGTTFDLTDVDKPSWRLGRGHRPAA